MIAKDKDQKWNIDVEILYVSTRIASQVVLSIVWTVHAYDFATWSVYLYTLLRMSSFVIENT
jgi:hypothetical protein